MKELIETNSLTD